MATMNLNVTSRGDRGKGVARKLRAAEKFPAVLYGQDREAQPLSIDDGDFRKTLATGAGSRVVLNLLIDGGEKVVAIIREIQRHPVSHVILHADLLAIDLKTPIEVSVPVQPIGTAFGVKNEGGILGWSRRELNIKVLPTKIPESLDLDISEMRIGQSLHVSDIETEDFEIIDDPETTICSVTSPRLVVEETAEGEEGEAAEGEEGAEGAEDSESASTPSEE